MVSLSQAPQRGIGRFAWRWTRRSFLVHSAICASFTFLAATASDEHLTRRRLNSVGMKVADNGFFSRFTTIMPGSQKKHTLTDDELACMEATVALLSFDLRPEVFKMLKLGVLMTDPLVSFRGVPQIRDAFSFLALCVKSSTPVVESIVRTNQVGGVEGTFADTAIAAMSSSSSSSRGGQAPSVEQFLMTLETEVELRFLPGRKFTFPSTVVITLQAPEADESQASHHHHHHHHRHSSSSSATTGRRVISSLEHHWFHGPIVGSPSYGLPVSVAGDAVRSWQGFWLSLITSYSLPPHAMTA